MDKVELYDLAREAKKNANRNREKAEEAFSHYSKLLELEPNDWEPAFYTHYFRIFSLSTTMGITIEYLQLFINDLPNIVRQVCNLTVTGNEKSHILLSIVLEITTLSARVMGYYTTIVDSNEEAEQAGIAIEALAKLNKVCADSISEIYGEHDIIHLQYYSWNQIHWILKTGKRFQRWIPNYNTLYKYASINKERVNGNKSNNTSMNKNKRGCATMLLLLFVSSVMFTILFH